jgi:hypothetical protein
MGLKQRKIIIKERYQLAHTMKFTIYIPFFGRFKTVVLISLGASPQTPVVPLRGSC